MTRSWPSVQLDDVARLRILAAGLPHAAFIERSVSAPFDEVWSVMGDLEHGVPRFEGAVVRSEILSRRDRGHEEDLELLTHTTFGLRMHYRAVLRPGWCLMRSRFSNIGMAASPEASGTRIAHFEDARWFGRLLRPLLVRNVDGDFERLARIVEGPDRAPRSP